MLQIECPYCGVRDEQEFTFGGPSHVERPTPECSDEVWTAYLYFRENARGPHAERWCHSFGCGQWFNAVRDTVTHVFHRVYAIGEARRELEESRQ